MELSHPREAEEALLQSIEICKSVPSPRTFVLGTGQICCSIN